jgi:hypothetical protein
MEPRKLTSKLIWDSHKEGLNENDF